MDDMKKILFVTIIETGWNSDFIYDQD